MNDGIVLVYGGKEFEQPDGAIDLLMKELMEAPDRAVRKIAGDLRAYLQRVATALAVRHGGAWQPDSQGSPNLHVRSGEGLRSIYNSIRVFGAQNIDSLTGQINTGKMTIHEKGGVIAATGSGWLTVPLPAALDARGIPLKPSARDWNNTFTQMSRKGNLIIFQNRGQRTPVPLYVLKKEVYIRPRLRMEETVYGELPFFLERLIDALAAEFTR